MSPHAGRLAASRALFQALNLRPTERWPVAMLWSHSFFSGLAVAYCVSAALPVYLSTFGVGQLPLAFIVAAIAELAIGYVTEQLEHRVRETRLLIGLVITLLLITLLFRVAIISTSVAAAFGILVWSRVMVFASQNAFWGLSSMLFDVRQGKRLFSLIDSGSFLAKIIGYFSVPLLLSVIEVPNLLVLSAAGSLCSVLVLRRIVRRYPNAINHAGFGAHPLHRTDKHEHLHTEHAALRLQRSVQKPVSQSVFRVLARHRYLATLAGIACLAFIAVTCIDYGFLREVEHHFEGESEIASYLAMVLGCAKVGSLLLKVGGVSRVFSKFGLARASMVLPLTLAGVTIAGLLVSGNSAGMMIWFFTANMLLVEVWSESVSAPAIVIALQPLHHHERHEGHRAIGGVIEPLALLFTGSVLYLLSATIGFTLSGISIVMLAVFGAWSVGLLLFDREYKAMLRRALKHRRLNVAEMGWDEEMREVIAQKLQSEHLSEVEYALRLIPLTAADFLIDHLAKLIADDSDQVKIAALKRVEEFEFSNDQREIVARLIESLLQNERTSPTVIGHALHSYAAVHSDLETETLKPWLNDPRVEVREGLLAGLIRFQGIDGVLAAGEQLLAMLHSDNPRYRTIAAEVVGRVGVKQFYHPLLTLLKDENSDVALAAVRAAGEVGHPHLIEPILDLYLQPNLNHLQIMTVEETLRSFGHAVLPHLSKRIEDGLFDSSRLQRIMRLLGYWGTERSTEMLVAFLTWPVTHHRVLGALRHAALRAIVQIGIPVKDSVFVQGILQDELERSNTLFELALGLDHANGYHTESGSTPASAMLLQSAIAYEIVETSRRVLLLLAILHDPNTILRVRDSLQVGSDEHRANALEILDATLPQSYAKEVILLLEASLVLEGRWKKGIALRDVVKSEIAESRISIHALLLPVVSDEQRFYDPWTVATAIYFAGMHVWRPFATAIESASLRDDIAGKVAQAVLSYHGESMIQLSESVQKENASSLYLTSIQNVNEGTPMPVLFERVILLKTVDLFHETPDPVLSHIAQALEEVHAPRGTTIIEKGELGTCLYIIVEGKVKVHDGEHVLAYLGSRQVVGELALLDPEPRSASVTALEETTLLKLDWEVFYDLMVDNIEIARGALATLARTIRRQNSVITELKSSREVEAV